MTRLIDFFLKHKRMCMALAVVLAVLLNSFSGVYASELVTESDGKSYDGLPEFPTSRQIDTNKGIMWYKYFDYIVYQDTTTLQYYLVCVCNDNGDLYIGPNNRFASTGSYNWYGEDLSTVKYTLKGDALDVYTCGEGATVWTFYAGYTSMCDVRVADTLLQSSCDIYTDSSCTSVFTKSAVVPSILGTSSSTILEILKNQIAGLVPLVIGFLICLMGFLKAWTFLKSHLSGA